MFTLASIHGWSAEDGFVGTALVIAGFFTLAFIFQLLWNKTIPQVLPAREITFWIALRLLLLVAILCLVAVVVYVVINQIVA